MRNERNNWWFTIDTAAVIESSFYQNQPKEEKEFLTQLILYI